MLRLILIAILMMSAVALADGNSYMPENGFVPDKETAIAIAIAVWNPIYGPENIQSEKPYVATLKNGVWHIKGSLPTPPPGAVVVGGVAEAYIAQSNGRIIRVFHGQ